MVRADRPENGSSIQRATGDPFSSFSNDVVRRRFCFFFLTDTWKQKENAQRRPQHTQTTSKANRGETGTLSHCPPCGAAAGDRTLERTLSLRNTILARNELFIYFITYVFVSLFFVATTIDPTQTHRPGLLFRVCAPSPCFEKRTCVVHLYASFSRRSLWTSTLSPFVCVDQSSSRPHCDDPFTNNERHWVDGVEGPPVGRCEAARDDVEG